jgi:hypothetical protein
LRPVAVNLVKDVIPHELRDVSEQEPNQPADVSLIGGDGSSDKEERLGTK